MINSYEKALQLATWAHADQRRKDGQVHNDYFNKSFNAIHKNEVMVELMEAVYKMTRLSKNLPQGSIDYIVNRVKIAFGDPTSRAQGLFKEKPEAYEEMGKTLNEPNHNYSDAMDAVRYGMQDLKAGEDDYSDWDVEEEDPLYAEIGF